MVKILNYIVSVNVKTTYSIFKFRTVHRFLHLIYFVPITHPIVLSLVAINIVMTTRYI